jgi:hypothetical protein
MITVIKATVTEYKIDGHPFYNWTVQWMRKSGMEEYGSEGYSYAYQALKDMVKFLKKITEK